MVTSENITADPHAGKKSHAAGTVILFLSFAVLAACICKLILSQVLKNKVPAPFTVIVLILGFILGIIMAHIEKLNNNFLLGEEQLRGINPHLLFYIFLPLLIFDSSFNSHFHVVKPQIISGILLAGPGVLISTGIIAICSVYILPYNWSWLIALMFGSILSATDPVAVVALLHESGASKSLAALIDLESLLNDGSAFVVFAIFKDIVVEQTTTAKGIIVDIIKFTIGGPAFGFGCGIVSVIALNLINNELEIEIISTFGLAYLVFYIADVQIGVSAVLAMVVMGLVLAKYKYCISSHVQLPMASTWHLIIYFVNILIFMITGIILAQSMIGARSHVSGRDFGFSIVLYIALHVGRLLSVCILHPFMKWSGVCLSWRESIVLTWSGLRGSMSVILGLIVESEEEIDLLTRSRILFHVCMIALLTLVINGTSSKFLVKFLGLDHGSPESETVLLQALEHMRSQTSIELKKMREDRQFVDVDWNMLTEYLPDNLVRQMDVDRGTSIHRRLSVMPNYNTETPLPVSRAKSTTTDIELLAPPMAEKHNAMSDASAHGSPEVLQEDFVLPILDPQEISNKQNRNIRNELVTRFLTALSVDYEKQWHLGMVRRRTLYLLMKSVEKAKHQHSLKRHWKSIIEQFRFSLLLRFLMRFTHIRWINKKVNELLFDHIFLTMELTLAFHSARLRMDNIRTQFPELANIDEKIWNEVCQEAHVYQQTASYILVDLQQSYQACWRIHMTKRCAQMLLKYESGAVTELYETGILDEGEYSQILELIEKKLYELEFYRVKMPADQPKAIENAFDLLSIFQPFPTEEKTMWETIMKENHKWHQPKEILLKKDEPVSTAYLVARGIVQCKVDKLPMYYRSGNIIGVDALFAQNLTAHGTYSVSNGLLEAYSIDRTLLNQFLDDENLAPSIYREIALQLLSNSYQTHLRLNRSHVKLLLKTRAKFYCKQHDLSIHLKENERLFIMAGHVVDSSNEQSQLYESIQFKIFEKDTELLLNMSTVAYRWTNDDEIHCSKDNNIHVHSVLRPFGSLVCDLFYPGYSGEVTKSSGQRRYSAELLRYGPAFKNIPEMPSQRESTLDHKF